jgi:MoaA/NifB/PqqE/SkfB family radical SAM enzyme
LGEGSVRGLDFARPAGTIASPAMKTRKRMRLLRSLAINKVRPSAPFVRVLPTDHCNLRCSYCWQHSADRHMMPLSLFDACLDNALELDVGLISFLGGEPTLWPNLLPALARCTQRHVSTDLTTNGTKLDVDYLRQLERAGLDLLNLSVDGLTESKESRKCALSRPGLLAAIQATNGRGRMRVRVNTVVGKHNWAMVRELIELCAAHDIAISLGYAMFHSDAEFDPNLHFSRDDLDQVEAIARHIRQVRRRGAKIIDPDAYFSGYAKFLARERFWLCNYATRRGWINIDPYGFIRDCTKKMHRLEFEFAQLRREQLPELRAQLAAGVETCNRTCYSNCAFDGAYFAQHKLQFLASGIT